MPQSFVLNLVAQSAIPQQFLQGKATQQLFFDLVDEVDPELGHVLRQDLQNRAYSLSALQVDLHSQRHRVGTRSSVNNLRPGNLCLIEAKSGLPLQFLHRQAIAPGTPCWWRISFLDDELFDHLIFLWNQLLNEPFQLGSGTITITNVMADMPNIAPISTSWPGMNWASSCTYRDIYENASAYEQDVHIQFVTPTAFEEGGCVSPMPTADAVFQTLRKRWNRYSGLVFAPSLVKNIVPLKFDIKTEDIQFDRTASLSSGTIAGCTGEISFRILGNDPLTTKRINALADFARYCGVGYGTPVGMGTVRRLVGPTAIAYSSSNAQP